MQSGRMENHRRCGESHLTKKRKAAAEPHILSSVATENLRDADTLALHGADILGRRLLCLYQLRHLHLRLPDLLVF